MSIFTAFVYQGPMTLSHTSLGTPTNGVLFDRSLDRLYLLHRKENRYPPTWVCLGNNYLYLTVRLCDVLLSKQTDKANRMNIICQLIQYSHNRLVLLEVPSSSARNDRETKNLIKQTPIWRLESTTEPEVGHVVQPWDKRCGHWFFIAKKIRLIQA